MEKKVRKCPSQKYVELFLPTDSPHRLSRGRTTPQNDGGSFLASPPGTMKIPNNGELKVQFSVPHNQ